MEKLPEHVFIPDDILTALIDASVAWERAEWLKTPRVMARVGIDAALDNLNEYLARVGEFEGVFNG